jgi:OOP family OmpA-OmpF porin
MKKITLLSVFFISLFSINAQEQKEKNKSSLDYNKWTFEVTVGQASGKDTYAVGYYSSDPKTFFGQPQANSISFGTRYMLNPKFGFKLGLHYEDLKPVKNNGSLPFEMEMLGVSVSGVVNAFRLFDIENQFGRFGLLVHAGAKIDRMTSKTQDFAGLITFPASNNIPKTDNNYGRTELTGGYVIGFTPQYRFSKKMSILLDVSFQNNYRQHFNWNGSYSESYNNLTSKLTTTSIGLTYSMGESKIHGDWAVIKDKNIEKIEALENKINTVEAQTKDTDKDGVPDYIDQENNSIENILVDARGKMIDVNKNGVSDDLEKYVEKSIKGISEKTTEDPIVRLVNEGYVVVLFESKKATPSVSTGIDFISTYLKNNPQSSIEITGYGDQIANNKINDDLAKSRAEEVKAILLKSGIETSRLQIVSKSTDNSVKADSEGSKKLVRKVCFTIKK